MPVYCYRTPDDKLHERVYPMGRAPDELTIGGKNAVRDIAAEHRGANDVPGAWPLLSDSVGVHPAQRKQAMEAAARAGVPTEFTSAGEAVFRDRAHRKAYCRFRKVHDLDGGYGDA